MCVHKPSVSQDIDMLQVSHHWLDFDKFSCGCSTIGSHYESVLINFILQ